jgi:hypothetical protein
MNIEEDNIENAILGVIIIIWIQAGLLMLGAARSIQMVFLA